MKKNTSFLIFTKPKLKTWVMPEEMVVNITRRGRLLKLLSKWWRLKSAKRFMMALFVQLQKTKADSVNSWSVDVSKIDQSTFDLSVKNPNKKEENILREPKEILEEMIDLDAKSTASVEHIFTLIK